MDTFSKTCGLQQRLVARTLLGLVVALAFSLSSAAFAVEVEVKMLYGGGAFVVIDGEQQTLRVGKTGSKGVKLLSANTKRGVFLVDGKKVTLGVSRRVGGTYRTAPKPTTRIAEGQGGHYWTSVSINGESARAVIDTGATSISMSAAQARAMNIPYRSGTAMKVATASGTANAYRVTLDRVKIGSAEELNVEASVIEGDGPPVVLIGNTFLRNFNMNIQAGVMTLERK